MSKDLDFLAESRLFCPVRSMHAKQPLHQRRLIRGLHQCRQVRTRLTRASCVSASFGYSGQRTGVPSQLVGGTRPCWLHFGAFRRSGLRPSDVLNIPDPVQKLAGLPVRAVPLPSRSQGQWRDRAITIPVELRNYLLCHVAPARVRKRHRPAANSLAVPDVKTTTGDY